MTDDDVAVVRWYECERRPVAAGGWVCPWDNAHTHDGPLSRRRGRASGDRRRVEAARYHWARHNEKVDA